MHLRPTNCCKHTITWVADDQKWSGIGRDGGKGKSLMQKSGHLKGKQEARANRLSQSLEISKCRKTHP